MKMWIQTALFIGSLALAGACSKAEDNKGTAETPAVTATTDQAAPTVEVELKEEDLAVETDFEEAAAQEITAANYQAELDTLEKEVAAGE